MAFTPKAPMKIIVAAVNLGFIAFAALNPQILAFTYVAVAVWGIHAAMAAISLVIAPKKGQSALFALEVLFVGTLSFYHLRNMPPAAGEAAP